MVSIVIPTYNRASKLKKTLDSITHQTYANWECIIVDDFSTDNTRETVLSYKEKDNRFRYVKNNHAKGAQGARNTGILQAKGEWIALFDSDDVAYPNYLEALTNSINNSDCVITSKAIIINENTGDKISEIDWRASGNITSSLLSGECYVNFNGTLIRKKALLEIGLLDENCPSHQEFDTHLRLSQICTYTANNSILSEYYVGGEDTISISTDRYIAGWSYILKKHRRMWRRKAYISFIVRARKIWDCCNNCSKYRKYKMQLLFFVPEVSIVLLKRRIWRM